MEIKIDKGLVQRISRLMMRMVPFLPVPEMDALFAYIRRSQTDFDRQVSEAVQALHNTSELVSTLQQRVEERMAKLQAVREDHERYSQLANIEAKKAEALLKQVGATLGKEQRKERWIALGMHLGVGFLFFMLGVIASDSFKAWVVSLWAKLFH